MNNEIKNKLTELIVKELLIEKYDLAPSEKQIIDICAGIISSMDEDMKDLTKKIGELEVKIKNNDIMIKDMLEDQKNINK